jgi:phage-related protein (TIGR01555 family)
MATSKRAGGESPNWGGARPRRRKKAPDAAVAQPDSAVFEPGGAMARPTAPVPAEVRKPMALGIDTMAVIMEAVETYAKDHQRTRENSPFRLPEFPPEAVPKKKSMRLAMDSNTNWATNQWIGDFAQGVFASIGAEGLLFPGYPYLSQLAQRPEYRVISETIADDATRKWIDFEVTGNEEAGADKEKKRDKQRAQALDEGRPTFKNADPDERKDKVKKSGKTERVKGIKDELDRLELRDRFYAMIRDDGFFGRSHPYLNFGEDSETPKGLAELKMPIGNGRDKISKAKVGKSNPLKEVKIIEPVWVYPIAYNATNPLRDDWYNPQTWYVMGKEIHSSRIPAFITRPVPDLLKPAYSFGGLSLSQMAKPYVDIWLTTRQAVADLIRSFSIMCLATDMQTNSMPGGTAGASLAMRAALFTSLRDNMGLFLSNKDTEEFSNVSAPLSGLDHLQAQAQEHMASVSRIPLVKLTGISPSGLNASSEGEIRVYYDTISAFQNRTMRKLLTQIINFVQLSLWDEIDPEITFEFEPLWDMTSKELAELQKLEAERDEKYVDLSALAPAEIRKRIVNDPKLPYTGLDPDDLPDLLEEEESGLIPEGGGKGLEAVLGAAGAETGEDPPDGGSKGPGGKQPGRPDKKKDENDKGSGKSVKPNGKGGNVTITIAHDQAADGTKMSQDAVGYTTTWADSRTQCQACVMFDGENNACDLVEGEIVATGHCRKFEPVEPGRANDAEWRESDHPRKDDGKFGTGSGAESHDKPEKLTGAESGEKPEGGKGGKKDIARELLTRGVTNADMLKALGWPTISMPAMAKSLHLNLEKVKEGGATLYRGTPYTDEQMAEVEAERAKKRANRRGGGPQSQPEETWSLLQFLAARGGIRADDALITDLRQSFGGKNKFVPGFGQLIRPNKQSSEAAKRSGAHGPMSLDQALRAAVEAGYISERGAETGGAESTYIAELLEAIDTEARGQHVYRQGYQPENVPSDPAELEKAEHDFIASLHDNLAAGGGTLTDEEWNRALEMWAHEGLSDPDTVLERLFIESRGRDIDSGAVHDEPKLEDWDSPPDDDT